MVEVLRPRRAGLDISKKDAKACVRIVPQGKARPVCEVTAWGAKSSQILELGGCLAAKGVALAVMEATGDYWRPFSWPLKRSPAPRRQELYESANQAGIPNAPTNTKRRRRSRTLPNLVGLRAAGGNPEKTAHRAASPAAEPSAESRKLWPMELEEGATRRRWMGAAAAAALAVAAGLGGCADDRPNLPTVATGGLPASAGAGADTTLEEKAASLYDCLRAEDVPVNLAMSDNRPTQIEFNDDVPVQWVWPDGDGGATGRVPKDVAAAWHAARVPEPAVKGDPVAVAPSLEVEGVDRSDLFAGCLAGSGYDPAEAQQANAETTDRNRRGIAQLVVEASNQWAACAREHGFPATLDAVLPADHREEPKALLPADITEGQLRQLLEACPNFDPERERRNNQLAAEAQAAGPVDELPAGIAGQPAVGFDYPGFDAHVVLAPGQSPPDPAVTARLAPLRDLLAQAAADYYTANPRGY